MASGAHAPAEAREVDDGINRVGRKLLVASIGVATMTYGACGSPLKPPSPDATVKEDAARNEDAPSECDPDPSHNPFVTQCETDAASDSDTGTDGGIDRQFVGNIIP